MDVDFNDNNKEAWIKIGYLAFRSNEESYEASRETVIFSLKDLHNVLCLLPNGDELPVEPRPSFEDIIK